MEKKDYNNCGHKLLSYEFSYIPHQVEMDKLIDKGKEQKKCEKCGLWLFDVELSTSPEYVNKKPLN